MWAVTEGCPFRRRGSSFQACCLATCNVSVRATPPSASDGSQTVAQRLRQQAGRSRQAARQAAPACSSRPFALVGTLNSPVPLTDLSARMPSEDGISMQKMQIFLWEKLAKSQQNAVGAPDMYYKDSPQAGVAGVPPRCSGVRRVALLVLCCTQTLSQDVKNQESLYLKAKTIQFYFVKIGYVSSRPRSRSR